MYMSCTGVKRAYTLKIAVHHDRTMKYKFNPQAPANAPAMSLT